MTVNPFSPDYAWTAPEKLRQLDRPMHEAFADFIYECSTDPTTRTAATTALVLSLWQLTGRALTLHPPSMLLIRPGENGPDSIDGFVRALIHNERKNEPRVQTEGLFINVPIDRAPRAMQDAVITRRKLSARIPVSDPSMKLEAEMAEEKFQAAQRTGHGYGRCRSYGKAWHPDYGLLSERDDLLILRLNDDKDRSGFCHDLLEDPGKIVFPKGLGANLFPTTKTVLISGAITTDLWTGKLAWPMLQSGMPFFVVPHVADTPLRDTEFNLLQCFANTLENTPLFPVDAGLRLPGSDWVRRYHVALRKRLAVLPVPAEFPALQAIHQLEEVCSRIVGVAWGPHSTEDVAFALRQDLFHHTLRGLVVGMASHLWFGMGLMQTEGREEMRKKAARLLYRLRREGPVTRTDLLKNFHLSAPERDLLLEELAGEGLLRLDGRTVAATSYREFVEGLYASDEFPAVENQGCRVSDGATT